MYQPSTFPLLNSKELDFMKILKAALVAPPVRALSRSGNNLTLLADVRNVRISCIHFGKQPDETTKPVCYWS